MLEKHGMSFLKKLKIGLPYNPATLFLGKHPKAILLDEALSSASDMGKELYRLFQEKAFEDLVRFEPFYLKSFVATKSKKKYF